MSHWTISKIKLNFDIFLYLRLKMQNTLHECTYFLKQLIHPITHLWQHIRYFQQISFYHGYRYTIEQYSTTRLLNIYNYSSMRWTKEKKQLKNWPMTFEAWSKTTRWVWRIINFLVLRIQVNHTIFLIHNKISKERLVL